jgi:hypothetical protein
MSDFVGFAFASRSLSLNRAWHGMLFSLLFLLNYFVNELMGCEFVNRDLHLIFGIHSHDSLDRTEDGGWLA